MPFAAALVALALDRITDGLVRRAVARPHALHARAPRGVAQWARRRALWVGGALHAAPVAHVADALFACRRALRGLRAGNAESTGHVASSELDWAWISGAATTNAGPRERLAALRRKAVRTKAALHTAVGRKIATRQWRHAVAVLQARNADSLEAMKIRQTAIRVRLATSAGVAPTRVGVIGRDACGIAMIGEAELRVASARPDEGAQEHDRRFGGEETHGFVTAWAR